MKDLIKKYLLEQHQQSNLDTIIDSLGKNLPEEILEKVKESIKSYIKEKGYTVKFLNSCSTGFAGVRTQKQIIICAPNLMSTLGDFIYTIFHELRHEEQMGSLKMKNPFVDMDLNDFEKLNDHYWKMEMDADQFAKNMVAKLVIKLKIPLEKSKEYFKLSHHIENYQYASNMVKAYIERLVMDIIRMKKDGVEFNDIQDHPFVKKHLDKLENFI
jgi:hypothetical protein